MLALTRKVDEKILIGDDVEVIVIEIGRGRVRLGVIAPPGVKVDREEVRAGKVNFPRPDELK